MVNVKSAMKHEMVQKSIKCNTCSKSLPLSGNTHPVSYNLRIRHTLGTVFELYQSSENMHCYFHIIKTKICIGHHMQRNISVFY